MKKIYLKPAMQAETVQAVSMLASSLTYGTTNVDGKDALVKGGQEWDIFGEYSADIDEE